MSNIIQFQFGTHAVRTVADDRGEPWFSAKDVCAVLGYRNDSDAVKKHCREHGVAKRDLIDSMGRKQEAAFINEGNLYRLIVKSRKPEAEKFEQLVMDEILPTIRKTGRYEVPPTTLSPAQQRHIQNRVAELAHAPGNSFASVYRSIKDQFQVGTYKDIPAEQYPALCQFLLCHPLEGEWLEAEPLALPAPTGTRLTDKQLYDVYFVCCHFASLYDAFKRHRLYENLTGLGSRAGIDMIDHFKDGSSGVARLTKGLADEFDAVQRRMHLNRYAER